MSKTNSKANLMADNDNAGGKGDKSNKANNKNISKEDVNKTIPMSNFEKLSKKQLLKKATVL